MELEHDLGSFLVIDCGSTTTRAALIDLVGGEFRLLAIGETATTVEAPWSRISIGAREAVRQVERLAGRLILTDQGQPIMPERDDGSGVDGIVATVNAAVPLRMAVVGLIRGLSVESLLKATDCSYVVVQNVVARDDATAGERVASSMQAMLREMVESRPDAILLGGGVDGGATSAVVELARDVAAVLSASDDGARVHVIFAGNREARTEIARVLGECCNLHVVNNARPSLAEEDLAGVENEIRGLYRETKMGRVPGFGELKSWVSAPIMTTAEALELVLRYLARVHKLDALAVDVGSATTHVAAVLGGSYGSTVSGEYGVGYGIGNVLDKAGMDRLLGWLPFEMDVGEAQNHILNKALRPMTVPETREELLLEQAAAREAISLTLQRAKSRWLGGAPGRGGDLTPQVDLIVGRGGALSKAPSDGQAALILLDAVQPTGVCALALDQSSILPQLGTLAALYPAAAAQALARDGFRRLGTVIGLAGAGREGSLALKLKVEYDDGQTIRVEVPYGELEVLPLMAGRRATVELRPASQFDVGLGRKGRGATTEVEGGSLGIIIDARGRPLSLPAEANKRRTTIGEWMSELGV
jgi:uncharacterized protein (TIGR01319 family)